MSVTTITKNNFNEEVMESNRPVIVDFWAGWCGPCRMLAPVIDEIAAENSDIKICKINVDEQPELAERFQVMSIPTLIAIDKGVVKSSSVGVKSKSQILNMLK